MKKILNLSAVLLTAAVFLSGCMAIHNGYMQGSGSLSKNNFTYVKMNAQGSSTATYIIGIGGMKKDDLANEAKQDLLLKNPLKDNQALVNLVVNYKTANYLGVYILRTCTVSGDIVEFKSN